MSPLMFRIFSLVAIALAAVTAQLKARADTAQQPPARQAQAAAPAEPAASSRWQLP